MIGDAENQGMAFRKLLKNYPSKAMLGIRQVMSDGDLEKIRLLVNIMNCHLANQPDIQRDFIEKLEKTPEMLLVLKSAGLSFS